jgi:hypothetical protein
MLVGNKLISTKKREGGGGEPSRSNLVAVAKEIHDVNPQQ